MTNEAKVKKKVRETLKALGAYYVMLVTSEYGSSGAPDFLVCWRSLFFGIEAHEDVYPNTEWKEVEC